jgi:rRNA maturation protein Nop10
MMTGSRLCVFANRFSIDQPWLRERGETKRREGREGRRNLFVEKTR